MSEPRTASAIAGRLHARTTTWPLPGKIAWWLLLLPLALGLFSAARPPGLGRRIGLGVAGVLAFLFAIGMLSEPADETPTAAKLASISDQAGKSSGQTHQAAADKAAGVASAAQAAAAHKAAADKAAADKLAADRAAAAKVAADKALADKALADKAAADKAAADKAAADEAAAEAARQAAAKPQPLAAPAEPAPAGADYANCTELRKDYPGGVARPGAVDKRSGGGSASYKPYYSAALYEQNEGNDRDGDQIACEA